MDQPFFKRPFVVLWIAQSVSALGGTFTTFTVSWLMYQLTDSLVAMSGVWIAFMIPKLLTNLVAGPYLDRFQYKVVMVASEWIRAVAFFVPTVLLVGDMLTAPVLIMAAVLTGIAEPLFRPAGMAYVAHILPEKHLQRGNSILEGTMQIVMLIGPALGGGLIVLVGPLPLLVFIVIALTVSGFLLLMLDRVHRAKTNDRASWLTMFKEGMSFYKVYPVLFSVGLLMMMINFSSGAALPMFLPYVLEHLHGTEFQYGLFMSVYSLGMILGSFLCGLYPPPKNLRRVMLGCLTVSSFLMMALGFITSIWIAIGIATMQGFFAMAFTINNTTFYQRRVPEHLRGRVFTVRALLAQSAIPLGAGVGGLLAEAYRFQVLFLILGGLMLVSTLLAWRMNVFYQLNHQPVGSEETTQGA
ncbi:MFS transporter [Halalkalibacterium halodurans]|uniref:MFS transporter n=1 Tax=Halalkalibacterium halodurans TaxID=86665 RepID=UPI002E1C6A42|nr:MFS transporter [Halalkalibacterium halodurans]MED4084130.1 MFS transporter [Halalkalibacterium halodurans]MED4104608.1 MFS transporter [Halalkalibacterium halodurans]MED4108336.1 MFS transporter [Halalkalibacterium halodurans]MED4147357.1 MFS transporter [Halalkalibacterium halodurans]